VETFFFLEQICGDFNIIRYSSGKNKKGALEKHSRTFNAVISAYELVEIEMTGGKFTWVKQSTTPTLEKLDRFLMSKNWEDIFPRVTVRKIPREVSDHNTHPRHR
jgi:endonuclease/exonuclease/phosphatase family metal-dependent hydrolase